MVVLAGAPGWALTKACPHHCQLHYVKSMQGWPHTHLDLKHIRVLLWRRCPFVWVNGPKSVLEKQWLLPVDRSLSSAADSPNNKHEVPLPHLHIIRKLFLRCPDRCKKGSVHLTRTAGLHAVKLSADQLRRFELRRGLRATLIRKANISRFAR